MHARSVYDVACVVVLSFPRKYIHARQLHAQMHTRSKSDTVYDVVLSEVCNVVFLPQAKNASAPIMQCV